MSFERLTRWECDFCTVLVEVKGYGLPESWFWTHQTGEELKHACPVCQTVFSDHQKGRSGSNKVVADE